LDVSSERIRPRIVIVFPTVLRFIRNPNRQVVLNIHPGRRST
jgi:hypothetical protein